MGQENPQQRPPWADVPGAIPPPPPPPGQPAGDVPGAPQQSVAVSGIHLPPPPPGIAPAQATAPPPYPAAPQPPGTAPAQAAAPPPHQAAPPSYQAAPPPYPAAPPTFRQGPPPPPAPVTAGPTAPAEDPQAFPMRSAAPPPPPRAETPPPPAWQQPAALQTAPPSPSWPPPPPPPPPQSAPPLPLPQAVAHPIPAAPVSAPPPQQLLGDIAASAPAETPAAGVGEGDAAAEFEDEALEATIVMVRGRATTAWKLIDVDGTAFPLYRSNVLGRKPSAAAAPEGAQLLALSDPGRVLSRTHTLIEIEDDRVWITDLASTNGTELIGPSGEVHDCAPRTRYALSRGQTLSLGGREITFESPFAEDTSGESTVLTPPAS